MYHPEPPVNYYQQPNLTPIFKIQPDSTHSLYVDGVPNDTTEREVARISYFKMRHLSSISWFLKSAVNSEIYLKRTRVFPMFR